MATINKIEMDGVEYGLEASSFVGILPISKGGTNQSTQAAARSNLGLGNVDNTEDVNKNVASSGKLTTQRNLGVDLSSGTARPFDGSQNVDNIGVKGTLPISKGGTGATSASQARTALGFPVNIAPQNTASRSANGWWKCASTGLLIQWGTTSTIGDNKQVDITLPISFSSAFLTCVASLDVDNFINGGSYVQTVASKALNRSVIQIKTEFSHGQISAKRVRWMAIGY